MGILRWVVGLSVFLALLLLSLQNAEPVTVRFYHWFSWQAPLIFLLLLAFAAGAAAGLLASVARSTRLKRQLTRLRREHTRQLAGKAASPVDAT
jgi:putative membrane protein